MPNEIKAHHCISGEQIVAVAHDYHINGQKSETSSWLSKKDYSHTMLVFFCKSTPLPPRTLSYHLETSYLLMPPRAVIWPCLHIGRAEHRLPWYLTNWMSTDWYVESSSATGSTCREESYSSMSVGDQPDVPIPADTIRSWGGATEREARPFWIRLIS